MACICIIPARGGSTRIPGKNIKKFHGKPIIQYSIDTAKASCLFDRIIVSTDSYVIEQIVLASDAEIWWRGPFFGRDDVGTQEVVRECLLGIKADPYDVVCCIYATAPLMSSLDLQQGHQVLTNFFAPTFVFSVGLGPLHDAGQFYWGVAKDFMNSVPLITADTRMIPIDSARDCDINTMDDWNRALGMYTELHK